MICRREETMWEGSYGREPFDLRLTVLRMLCQIPLIAAVTLLGTLVFGGGYYAKHILLRGDGSYAAESVFRLEYAVDNVEDMMDVFINAATWNIYIKSKVFLDEVQTQLGGEPEMENEELAECMEAFVLTDVRMPSITVTTQDPEQSGRIARAVEAAMVRNLSFSEIASVTVLDPGEPYEVIPDVRPGRAFLLSAVLSCFFAVVVLLLKEIGDDSIWLPSTIGRRYGLKVAGTPGSRELAENMRYFFREAAGAEAKKNVAVCAALPGAKAGEVLQVLRERCPDVVKEEWFAVETPLTEGNCCGTLRDAAGILLAVPAGRHVGKRLEYVLEYLKQQDCEVTAALLWGADEKLIRRYYFGRTAVSGKEKGSKKEHEG